jgi:flavin reductase (DIM6/NTAB) family NADH-FMN oxidoreductase RutF
MLGGSNPPSLMISPTLTSQAQPKDTLRNIRETGEFVVNLVSRAMVEDMNQTSRPLPSAESEWDWTSFTAVPSDHVLPARVLESPAQLECRLYDVVEHGLGPNAARYVIGEVHVVHHRELMPRLVARLGGPDYLDTAAFEVFSLARPS